MKVFVELLPALRFDDHVQRISRYTKVHTICVTLNKGVVFFRHIFLDTVVEEIQHLQFRILIHEIADLIGTVPVDSVLCHVDLGHIFTQWRLASEQGVVDQLGCVFGILDVAVTAQILQRLAIG